MRLFRFHLLLTLLSLSACQSPPARADDAFAITLRPGLPVIEKSIAPPLTREIADGDAMPSRITFEITEPLHVGDDAADGPRRARLKADGSADRVVLTVWDWNLLPVFEKVFEGAVDQTIRLITERFGVYLVTLHGFMGDKCEYRLVRSFGSVTWETPGRQWKDSGFSLGVCAFPGRYHWKPGGAPVLPEGTQEHEALREEAVMMEYLGFGIARLDVSMVLPEKPDAPIDWKRMDAAVEAYTSRGMKLALQVMHPPDWAIDEKYKQETKDKWRFPRREEAYRRYVREIVSRYGKHAAFVQVYNEPDQVEFWAASPEEFVKEFEWAKDEVRKISKELPITNGGYAFIDPARTEFYVKSLRGQTELQAYHSHGNLRELIRDHEHMRRLHKEAGYEKPRFINTESGYAVWRLDQERTQAAVLLQKILYSWAHGDEGMLLFASRMTKGPGPGSRTQRDFGLLDAHFCPRFAYGAVAAFSKTFAGAKFDRVLREANGVHVYLFTRGADRLVAVFSADKSQQLVIESDASEAEMIDAMGNASEVKDAKVITVEARSYLTTVELEGATAVKLRE